MLNRLLGFTSLPAHCRTTKRNSVEVTELLTVCPQNKENWIIKFKCNTKSKFYCEHLTLFSQDLQIYVWKSVVPNRFFALSFTQNPKLSRAGILWSLTELIHLTSSNNSIREEGATKTKTKPKTQHKPYLSPLKQNQSSWCYTGMNARKEHREINPFEMLTFSARRVNHSNCVSLHLNGEGNSRKKQICSETSAVNLNKVVFKKPSEIHYTTTNQRANREVRSLSGCQAGVPWLNTELPWLTLTTDLVLS